jgi:hypothetical protein
MFTADQIVNAAISGAAADPYGAGLPNFLEYAFGGPTVTNWQHALGMTALHDDTDYDIVLTFRERKLASDVNYELDISRNLIEWVVENDSSSDYSAITSIQDDGNGETETVTVKIRLTGSGQNSGYIRLRVNQK